MAAASILGGISSQHWFDYSNLEVQFTNTGLQSLTLEDINAHYILWYWRDRSLMFFGSDGEHQICRVKKTFPTITVCPP